MITDVEDIPIVSWQWFLENWIWKQGEHVTLVGPTGQGKSTLIEEIEYRRKYVIVLVTKKRDPITGKYQKRGYKLLKSWKGVSDDVYPKVVLQPPFAKDEPKERIQREEFKFALDRIFEYGGFCTVIEEAEYMAKDLKLDREMRRLWQQGRSLNVSVVAGTQRPAFIPVVAYSSATHLFFFRSTDEYDLQRMGGLGGMSNRTIREAVSMLQSHQILYLNTRTGQMLITKVKV